MNKRDKITYLFLLPAFILFIAFSAVPIGMVGYLSFFKTNYVKTTFVGFKNYIDLLSDKPFQKSFFNSLLFAAIGIPMMMGLPLLVSLSVYRMSERVKNTVRFMFYVPTLASPLVMASVWLFVFDYRRGIVSWLLGLIGLEPVAWFANQVPAIFILMLTISFSVSGAYLLLFLAILQAVPRSTIDAARIDGASYRQIKYRILVPIIAPWLFFFLLMGIISTFQIFEVIWRMTNGGPRGSTATMLYNVYETGFLRSAYGVASAKSLVMMAILLSIALLKNRLEGKKDRII